MRPKKIFVEKIVELLPVTTEVCCKLPDIPVEYVNDYREVFAVGDTLNDVYKKSKEYLILAKKNGDSVKPFRCLDGLVGKTEYFIVHGNNCLFDCKYCFLQNYFTNVIPTVFVNHDEILDSIRSFIVKSKDKNMVFHAGELCDSFLYDNYTKFSCKLIKLFSEFPNVTLELRTKTTTIDNVLNIYAGNNIIVSWTFSPQNIIDIYEHKSPSLIERISAAEKVQKAGYCIGICLDPIIYFDGWYDCYEKMINTIFSKLDNEKLAYVSLGGFRFLPSLARIVKKRDSKSDLMYNEFVRCIDGKYRYFRSIRAEIYKKTSKAIRERCKKVKMYLCMETPEVWNDVTSEINLLKPL